MKFRILIVLNIHKMVAFRSSKDTKASFLSKYCMYLDMFAYFVVPNVLSCELLKVIRIYENVSIMADNKITISIIFLGNARLFDRPEASPMLFTCSSESSDITTQLQCSLVTISTTNAKTSTIHF